MLYCEHHADGLLWRPSSEDINPIGRHQTPTTVAQFQLITDRLRLRKSDGSRLFALERDAADKLARCGKEAVFRQYARGISESGAHSIEAWQRQDIAAADPIGDSATHGTDRSAAEE